MDSNFTLSTILWGNTVTTIGVLNFLDLDDIPVLEEGEIVGPLSIIRLPYINQRPALPRFERSPTDPFLRQLNASRKKRVIIVDDFGQPGWVLDADQFLRDALFNEGPLSRRFWFTDLRLALILN